MSNQVHRTISNRDFFDKAEWEGGIMEFFFSYGVDPFELNEPYATLLDKAQMAVGELEDALTASGWDQGEATNNQQSASRSPQPIPTSTRLWASASEDQTVTYYNPPPTPQDQWLELEDYSEDTPIEVTVSTTATRNPNVSDF